MILVGIDPSYSSTGLVIVQDGMILHHEKYKCSYSGDVYHDDHFHLASSEIARHVEDVIRKVYIDHPDTEINIVCETPALATPSGAYLGVISGALQHFFTETDLPINEYIWVPPTACDSFTKNKEHKKRYLVDLVKSKFTKRINHDEATAYIFCELYFAIKANKYKNMYFVHTRGDNNINN